MLCGPAISGCFLRHGDESRLAGNLAPAVGVLGLRQINEVLLQPLIQIAALR